MNTRQNGEIVRVLDAQSLINAESYQCRYRHSDNLAPGYYMVVWPTNAGLSAYDESASFIGPFRSRADAASAAGVISQQ
jgi:hypothetical protein